MNEHPVKLCCVTPHPPILVPEVGRREAMKIENTAAAFNLLADEIETIDPDAVVIISPHSEMANGEFTVKAAPSLAGSFKQFGVERVSMEVSTDTELAEAVVSSAAELGVNVISAGGAAAAGLDHGVLVPLYFLQRNRFPVVILSLSYGNFLSHYQLGKAIRNAAAQLGRRLVFVASGDMSHYLKETGPYGYNRFGPIFDEEMVEILNSGEYLRLFSIDRGIVEEAGECGLRSVFTLAGIVDGYDVDSEVLSYEGPFGIGYLVARVVPRSRNEERILKINPGEWEAFRG